MSSEWELDEGIKSIKSAWRREHTARTNLEKMLENAEAENAKLREQMERLVTLLRNDCDIDASWDGLRGFWLIGLTENGCLMRDRACKAEAESAKLCAHIDELCADIDGLCAEVERTKHEQWDMGFRAACDAANVEHAKTIDYYEVENKKLRELCHDLRKEYAYLRARPRRFYVQHEARMAAIDARMRELGIEVPE